MSETQATPRPWTVADDQVNGHGGFPIWDNDHHIVCVVYSRSPMSSSDPESWTASGQLEAWANAELIVRAVNAHDELVAALEKFVISDGLCLECYCRLSDDDDKYIVGHDNECAIWALLKKARGATS